jgi:Tol biopolymer transport system component
MSLNARNLTLACSAIVMVLGASPARAEFLYGRLLGAGSAQPNGSSNSVDVSSNGKTVVFSTGATNWVSGPVYNGDRVVAVDMDTGFVETISRAFEGAIFRGEEPAVSADGRYVAFLTFNTSYGPNWQVLRKDRQTGVLDVVSTTAAAAPASSGTNDDTVSISDDGRYVAFETNATNFGVAAGSNYEIFVKDMLTGAVKLASVSSSGGSAAGTCEIEPHALSGDGRYLVMVCGAAMVPGASSRQVYLRDLQANTTELLSRAGTSATSSTAQVLRPAISPNARFVSFQNRGFGGLGQR